ncbi:toxin-activating lysine-acyltransferase [Magnetococcales bacterium HHB-1]
MRSSNRPHHAVHHNPEHHTPLILPNLLTPKQRSMLKGVQPNRVVGYDGPIHSKAGPNPAYRDCWSPQEKIAFMGLFMWLCYFSKVHRLYSLAMIQERFYPSISHNAFRFYFYDQWPLAFINWAWVSDAVHQKKLTLEYDAEPDQWMEGQHLWFMEIIAPFNHGGHVTWDMLDLFTHGDYGYATFADDQRTVSRLRRYYCAAPE